MGVWQDTRLPDDRLILPGVVSHATNVVEHPELVAERIGRFARLVGRERVIASTDCGLGGRVHRDIAWAKLETLAQGAAIASKQLRRCRVCGLAYGIALAAGKVPPPEAKLYEQFPEYSDLAGQPGRDRLTIRHALSMTLGLDWDELTIPYGDPRNAENAMERLPTVTASSWSGRSSATRARNGLTAAAPPRCWAA